jgi:hypothetical protein
LFRGCISATGVFALPSAVPFAGAGLTFAVPAREIAWDRDNAIVSYPPSFVGTCQSVVTLYPQPPKRGTFEAGGEAIGHGFPNADFLIMPSERKLAVIEDQAIFISASRFAEQPQ